MEFLEYLVRRSELENKNTEYFNYRQPVKRQRAAKQKNIREMYKSLNQSPLAEDYVVFDLETTGLSPGANAILEIGAVRVIGNRVEDRFSALVNPKQYIPKYLSQKIHITNEMVEDKPFIEEVLPEFTEYIVSLPLVAHNAPFDMSFLIRSCEDMDISLNNPAIDTLYLSRRYLKECGKYNLGFLADYFNIPLANAHRAYCDAEATQKLFEIIKERIIALQNK